MLAVVVMETGFLSSPNTADLLSPQEDKQSQLHRRSPRAKELKESMI